MNRRNVSVRRKRRSTRLAVTLALVVLVLAALAVGAVLLFGRPGGIPAPGATPSASATAAPTPTPEPTFSMNVAATANTSPEAFGLISGIFEGATAIDSYMRPDPISFGTGAEYTGMEGVITFRGNSYREGPTYGAAEVTAQKLEAVWDVPTGSVTKGSGSGYWTGSGWTGQPLIVKWPEETRRIMNLDDGKKADPDLVEVIYACLDGNIYFMDLRDGTPTRPAIKTGGGPIKGTCSLYPDGTPMLFVGQGDNLPDSEDGQVKYRIYSLIDQSLIYTLPDGSKDPNAYRSWHAYDSSALIDAGTDTLIEPGENGILYTVKLNTQYDPEAGTLSVNPDPPVKLNYTTPEYSDSAGNAPGTRWWGFEASAVAWRNYIYLSDNGGKLMCVDVNTMKVVWVQDIWDDSNSTPLFEESMEDGTAYIYISTSLHITADKDDRGPIPIWKIDAATGEIVWESEPYDCHTVSGVSGGVEATGLLGRHDLSNLVIYPIARTPDKGSGVLAALDRQTGKEVWSIPMDNYAWSSPAAVYTPGGKGYIIQCDSAGNMFLIDGAKGEILDTISLETNIEASPAIFGDMIVVGTRGQQIFGVKIR